jgi:NADH-quinone oxidoreductase subunit E
MLFTVETVACLGACGLAPVVVIDDQVHGQVTPESAVKLIEEVIAKEVAP